LLTSHPRIIRFAASGFVVNFPSDSAAIGERLAKLRQANWIDIKTVGSTITNLRIADIISALT
jgi:hypothetical protein